MRLIISLLVGLLAFPGMALAEKDIAYVNPIQAISQSDEVKSSQLKMKSEFGDQRDKLQKLRSEISDIQSKLKKEGMTLSDNKKESLKSKRQSKMIQARQLSKLVQKRLKSKQQDMMKKMRPKVMSAVEEIAQEQGYDLVLNIQSVMFASGEKKDITKQVIKKLNQSG